MGIEVVVADLSDGLPDGELSPASWCSTPARPAGPRPAPGHRRRPRARRAGRRRRRPAGAHPARGARRARRRRRRRLLPAVRRPAVLRRPARRLHGRRAPGSSGTCPAGWSGSPSTPRAARPTGSPCRPASSTSAATRRPPTSAPPRCCWPSSRPCTPSTTARTGCGRSRRASTATPPVLAARPARRRGRGRARRRSSTPSPRGSRAAPPRSSPRARERGLHLRLVDEDRVGISTSETTTAATPDRGAAGVRCSPAPGPRRASVDRPPATPCRRRCAAPRRTSPTRCSRTHHSETAMLRYLRAALRARLRARPRHDPARLLHHEAQRDHRDGAGRRCRASPTCTRSRPPRTPSATASSSSSSRAGWPRSPATTRSPSSPTPAPRASWPACSRSAATTAPAARAPATSA